MMQCLFAEELSCFLIVVNRFNIKFTILTTFKRTVQ